MRQSVVIAIGLASLAALASVEVAFAETREQRCENDFQRCKGNSRSVARDELCQAKANTCYQRIPKNQVHNGPFQPGRSGDGGSGTPGGGGGSKPKPGTHRTADGGTVMVTPEGKEWIWNGKYTSVVRVSRPGYVETITVMQGDPDVSIYKTVDGKTYNVADPKYAAAIAKQEKEKTVVVRDHRNDKPPPPSTGGSTNGGTPSGGTAGGGATHGAAPGSAPSTTTPGNAGVSTTANTGTVVRDHRPGGANGVSALPPSVAAPGINKKPAKNAQ